MWLNFVFIIFSPPLSLSLFLSSLRSLWIIFNFPLLQFRSFPLFSIFLSSTFCCFSYTFYLCCFIGQNVLFLVSLHFQIPCPSSSFTFFVALSSTFLVSFTVVVTAGYKFAVPSRFYSRLFLLDLSGFLPAVISFSRSTRLSLFLSFLQIHVYPDASSFFIFFLRLLLKHFLFLFPPSLSHCSFSIGVDSRVEEYANKIVKFERFGFRSLK